MIHVSELKDGDVAVIVSWTNDLYIGIVVQRHDKNLISIGCDSGCSWPGLLDIKKDKHLNCKVKLLPPGTEIVLT